MNGEYCDGTLRALRENPEGLQKVAQRSGFEDGQKFLAHLDENPDAVRALNHYFEHVADHVFNHPDKQELFRFVRDTLSDEAKVALAENEEVAEWVFKEHYREDAWVLVLLDQFDVKHQFDAYQDDSHE
jgi:hypothetical protein